MLNRIQVQRTGISKKIQWIEGNKSDSPYLRGRFVDVGREFVGGLISRIFLTSKPTLVHQTGTGRGPRAATGTDKEDFVLLERATFTPTWMRPLLWTQVAGKEKLGTSIPTVFQQNIIGIFLNAVRIRRDNKNGVLHTTKLDIKIQSKIKVYEHCIYSVHTKYVHVSDVYVHV